MGDGTSVKGFTVVNGEERTPVNLMNARVTPGTLIRIGAVYEALGKASIAYAKSMYQLARALPSTWELEVSDVGGADGDGI
jgi:hypothetical protein